MKFILFISWALFLLAGCSSNVKTASNFCTEKSWYERGVDVGSEGGSAKLLDKYLEKCKDAKTRENLREYQKGFIAGMKQYCTFENGYELAMAGGLLNKLCPNEFKEDFVAGYKSGKIARRENLDFLEKAAGEEWKPEPYNSSQESNPNTNGQ